MKILRKTRQTTDKDTSPDRGFEPRVRRNLPTTLTVQKPSGSPRFAPKSGCPSQALGSEPRSGPRVAPTSGGAKHCQNAHFGMRLPWQYNATDESSKPRKRHA